MRSDVVLFPSPLVSLSSDRGRALSLNVPRFLGNEYLSRFAYPAVSFCRRRMIFADRNLPDHIEPSKKSDRSGGIPVTPRALPPRLAILYPSPPRHSRGIACAHPNLALLFMFILPLPALLRLRLRNYRIAPGTCPSMQSFSQVKGSGYRLIGVYLA
jgi:hypothetical protein